ncbi:HAD family hydrolase [Lactobacillus delbrueckii]
MSLEKKMEEKKKIKLIATDMDGTLVNDAKEVPASFAPWVLSHPDQQMVIASGRPYYTNEELFKEIKDHLIFIGDNGGLIYQQGQVLAKAGITAEEAKFCLDLFKDEPLANPILCGASQAICHDPKGDRNFLKQLDTYYIKRRYVEDLEAEVNSDEIIKFTVYIEGGAAESIYRQLPEIPGNLSAVLAGPEWIDIVNKDANKGAAVKKIVDLKGIKQDEILAFGDYLNDLTMLEAAGTSYAMVNGHPDSKKVADHIAPSNNDEGVMQILRKLFD